jgi:hypothetical protein
MNSQLAFKGISIGVVSGALCGWAGIVVNQITGAFPIEMNAMLLIVTFAIGGAVSGVVVAGLMAVTNDLFLTDRPIFKAVVFSVGFWFALRIGAVMLTVQDPTRFHPVMEQSVQGLLMALLLGVVLGCMWKMKSLDNVFER